MSAYPKTKIERTAFWQRQIDYGLKRVKPYFEAAEVLIRQYENIASTQREADQESSRSDPHIARVKANLIFGWIEQSIANLLDRNPSFIVTPLRPDSADGAQVVSAVANYWYRELAQLHQDERCLLDAFLCPYGVKKLGWTVDVDTAVYELVTDPQYDFADDIESDLRAILEGNSTAVTIAQDHLAHIQAKQVVVDNLMDTSDHGVPEDTVDLLRDNIIQHKQLLNRLNPDPHVGVQWDAPFAQRWAPDDFVMDPFAQDGLSDARWIAFRWRKPLADILANPAYDSDELSASSRPEGAPDPIPGADDDFGMVIGWEIWARNFPVGNKKRRNLLITIAEGHPQPLRYEEEWPYESIEDYPCEILSFQTSVKNWYAKPTLVMAGSDNIQALANEILDSYLSVIRKQKNILFYDPDFVTPDDMDSIIGAPDMAAYPVRGLSTSNGHIIQPLSFGNIPEEKGMMLNQIMGLFDRAAGTPQPNRMDAPDTATASTIEDRRTTAREARRGNLLGEFQLRTARKFWQLTVQYKPDRLYQIDPQAMDFVAVDDKIAKGEYHFRIDIGSQANAVALERKQWSDLLNLFAGLAGQFQQLYNEPPNLVKIAERLLKRGFNDQHPEDILPMLNKPQGTEPNPVEEQAAQQQMLQGTPAEPPSEGPSMGAPPTEVAPQERVGAALPRQFQAPAPSNSNVAGAAQGV